MSHYSLLVLSNDESDTIDERMAPYCEELTVAPYIKYTMEEAIARAKEIDKKLSDEEAYAMMADDYIVDKFGNMYTDYNPNSKWDWYEIGGRWSDFLRFKDGSKGFKGRLDTIDFSLDKQEYDRCIRFWEIVVEHKPLLEGEKMPFFMFNEKYYTDFYGDKQTFARRSSGFSTFAVLDQEGIWYEKGEMGWFGCSGEEPCEAADWDDDYLERFILHEDPTTQITIVDCHI